ncbi:MAG TPA: Omp28-related outer membrane protein [Bacteroidia bacterium]|nr:Omp28-related outer membrane protein [Bacteroidia bacterium]
MKSTSKEVNAFFLSTKKAIYVVVLGLSFSANAQSPKTVLVEHFTNTWCSICASKNPAMYQTLSNYPQVLHIAFHPSSPYPGCVFNVQNMAENDARANYYNAYGGTPKIVLNGKLLSSNTPLINNTTIDTALNKNSPVEISATELLIGLDSMKARVVVRTTGITNITNVRLFAGVAENPVNYTSPNGEQIHHDVFRKALTAAVGNQIVLPQLNDSLVFEFTYFINPIWNVNAIYTMAYVQIEASKEVLNAVKSIRVLANSLNENNENDFAIHFNSITNQLVVASYNFKSNTHYSILNIKGQVIAAGDASTSEITVNNLPKGVLYFRIGRKVMKFVNL